MPVVRVWLCAVAAATLIAGTARFPAEADEPALMPLPPAIAKHRYSGRVLRLSEALAARGIRAAAEMEAHIVLELADGTLLPILADWRGRAFYQDERLRNRLVTLVAHRRSDVGYLQPLMVFTYDDQGRPQLTDYWCDICAIPMYEIKPCECCQGEIRLRFTPQPLPDDVPEWVPAAAGPGGAGPGGAGPGGAAS